MPRPGTMVYLISYDLPSTAEGNRRRNRIAKRLEGLGLRVQYSVFELELSPEKLPSVVADLENLIDPKEDSVRIYPFCASCRDRVQRVGVAAPCEYEGVLVW